MASSKHRQTRRFLDTLTAYLLDAQRMIIKLHRQANERPSLTFVDHHAGIVDARTGKPLASLAAQQGNGADDAANAQIASDMMMGYGFFGNDEFEKFMAHGQRKKNRVQIGEYLLSESPPCGWLVDLLPIDRFVVQEPDCSLLTTRRTDGRPATLYRISELYMY